MKSKNIINIISDWAEQQPDKIAYSFKSYPSELTKDISYECLLQDIHTVAANLTENTHATSLILCFAYNEMYEFIQTFFGCLAAGIIAIPLYPPKNKTNHVISAILQSHENCAIVTTTKTSALLGSLVNQQILTLDKFSQDLTFTATTKNELAFLQYTSGSIGTPKGVMVSHQNIIANQAMIQAAFGQSQITDVVGWLPLHHDMGLIGNVIQPIFTGARGILMSPTAFFQNPMRWLQLISEYRAHTSGGPNFCYQLCVDLYDEQKLTAVDLSDWKVAFNGAEPINYRTIKQFCERYKKYGFHKRSIFPCYGLAEATLFVTGAGKGNGAIITHFDQTSLQSKYVSTNQDDNAIALVSSGYISDQIVIADPDTRKLSSELEVGEVCLQGDHVTCGYWAAEELTENAYNCLLSNGQCYFRTGDLGFIYQDNLYVTGRLKDLIIIRGKNYYPQDIEYACSHAHSQFQHTKAAAFETTLDNEAKLIVVQEMPRSKIQKSREELKQLISEAIVKKVGIRPYNVVLVRYRSLPLTTSGKIKRRQIKLDYEQQHLKTLSKEVTATKDQNDINSLIVAFDPKLNHFPMDRPIVEIGYDSLDTVKLVNYLNNRLGLEIELDSLELELTLQNIVDAINLKDKAATFENKQFAPFYLTDNQLSLYFQQKLYPNSTHYIISESFHLDGAHDVDSIKKLVEAVIAKNPVLNAQLEFQSGNLQIKPYHDLDKFLTIYQNANVNEIESIISQQQQLLTKLNHGLANVNLFLIAANKIYINVNIHHIIFDFWSASILVNDVRRYLTNQPLSSREYFQDYVALQKGLLRDKTLNYSDIWQGIIKNLPINSAKSTGLLSTRIGPRDAHIAHFEFKEATMTKLVDLSEQLQCGFYELLIAVFSFTVYKYTTLKTFIIMSPFNGRTNSRFHKTVGYFLNVLPLIVAIEPELTVQEFVLKIRALILTTKQTQCLPIAKIVEIINHHSDNETLLPYELMFTYQKLPQDEQASYNKALTNSELTLSDRDLTLTRIPQQKYTIEVDWDMAIFDDKQLHGYLKYNHELFDHEFIQQFLGHFLAIADIFVQTPNVQLKHINMLTSQEMEYYLQTFNADNVQNDDAQTLCEIFDQTVKSYPEQTAIIENGKSITYQELSEAVAALAEELS